MLTADVNILHESCFYKILKYTCHCQACCISDAEYNGSFNISFIRKGFFEYRTFRRNEEAHAGRLLISKPGYEHTTRHIDNQPDVTTTLEFKLSFYTQATSQYSPVLKWFFVNNDIHSVLVSSNAELEYLHAYLVRMISAGTANSLQVDELVLRILDRVMTVLGSADTPPTINDNLKKYHLFTIEAAREYLLSHFREQVSLQQLAEHCNVSVFHFSRIFKTILNVSPHQFLASLRLQHAKILLETSDMPITDIAFDCGFNSLEHFVTAYKKQFAVTPSLYRNQMAVQ